jgi:hypothetical protein
LFACLAGLGYTKLFGESLFAFKEILVSKIFLFSCVEIIAPNWFLYIFWWFEGTGFVVQIAFSQY